MCIVACLCSYDHTIKLQPPVPPLRRQIPLLYGIVSRLQQTPALPTAHDGAGARALIPAAAATPPAAAEPHAASMPAGYAGPSRGDGGPRGDGGAARWAVAAGPPRAAGGGQRIGRDSSAAAAAAAGLDIRSSMDPDPIEL